MTYKFTTKGGEVISRLRARKLNIDGVWGRKGNQTTISHFGTFILMISKAQLDHRRYPSEIKLIISSYLQDIDNAVR